MGNKNVIEIYVDYIYYIPVGEKNKIDEMRKILSETNDDENIEYYSLKTIIPLANYREIFEKKKKCSIYLDPIVEEAQAHAFSHYSETESHMLVCLKKNDEKSYLVPHKFHMSDGDDPEKEVVKEFSKITSGKIDKSYLHNIKPIAVIGSNKDVILYSSKILNGNNKELNNKMKMLEFLESIKS